MLEFRGRSLRASAALVSLPEALRSAGCSRGSIAKVMPALRAAYVSALREKGRSDAKVDAALRLAFRA
jgi:hypothetical protein